MSTCNGGMLVDIGWSPFRSRGSAAYALIILGTLASAGRRRENCSRATRSFTEHPRAARLLGILLVSDVKKHQGCMLLRVLRVLGGCAACAVCTCTAGCGRARGGRMHVRVHVNHVRTFMRRWPGRRRGA